MQPPQANTLAAPRRAATQTDVTNQQIIRQNIQIHAQLRQQQQMYQDCLLENLELKTKVTGLETENARLSSDLAGLKKEVAERAPSLDLIAAHLSDVSRFIRMITEDGAVGEWPADSAKVAQSSKTRGSRRTQVRPQLFPIQEQEEKMEEITDHMKAVEL